MGDGIGNSHPDRCDCGTGPAGFSLIELLVVIAIVSILAVGASLAVGRQGDTGDLARFREVWELQRSLAIEGRGMRGMRLGPKGLQVMIWRMAEAGPVWQAQGGPRAWRGRVVVSSARPVPSGEPDIVFLPNGRSSAFSVRFDADNAGCDTDGWADLTCG